MDLKIDPLTWDIAVENGKWVTVDGLDAITQKIAIRLRMFYGEWALDRNQGFPWVQEILGQKIPDFNVVQARILQAVRSVPEVIAAEAPDVDYDPITRTLSVGDIRIVTRDGPLTVNSFTMA